MNKFLAIGLGAAAVVVAVLVGYQIFGNSANGGVGTGPPPAHAPSAGPQATLAPLPASGAIDAGTYVMTDGATSFSITIPAGWDAASGGRDIRKHRDQPNEVAFEIYTPGIRVYPDACASEGSPPATGPTADDLLAALRTQENSDVTEPVDVIIGGHPAMRLDISIPEGLDSTECNDGVLKIWADSAEGYLAGLGPTGTTPVTIVEPSSGRMVYSASSESEATAPDLAELQAMIDSIEFEPTP